MLMAALMEICPSPSDFIARMNEIGLKNTRVCAGKVENYGITGVGIDVIINGETEEEYLSHEHEHHHAGEHPHSSIMEIESIINSLDVPCGVKEKAREVYSLLADAESRVHGKLVSEIHFHEVGALDAICDIVGVCMAIDIISPDEIIASEVCVGSGSVKCLHGILPVPAPATAFLLTGVPIFGGGMKGETCTPTAAALLKTFVRTFGEMPKIRVEKIGTGMGKRDFGRLTCVRAFLGET